MVCATWAYRVNYATQEAMGRLADLRQEIAAEREAIAVLNAEWAYLNRPDRLRALVAANAAALGLDGAHPRAVRRGVDGRLPARARRPRRRRRGREAHADRSLPVIRRPLRPLARILSARAEGKDPDLVEAEERAARLAARHRAERVKAETRLLLLGVVFILGFSTVAGRMALLSAAVPVEPRGGIPADPIHAQRADIVDRNGAVLATNIVTASLYAQPEQMIDPRGGRRRAGGDLPRPRRRTSSTPG